MGKRKSITGARKRPKRITTLEGSAARSVAVDTSRSASTILAGASAPKRLLSVRDPPSGKPLSRKREADRVGLGSKGAESLKSWVKHVSQDIISSRWAVLDGDSQAKVEELLRSIELPVLAVYTSEQRKIGAQVALRSITKMLCTRLPRMPFPPKAKEMSFDYKRLVKDNRNLQQSLATSVACSASLVIELEKQNTALSSERQDLKDLDRAYQNMIC